MSTLEQKTKAAKRPARSRADILQAALEEFAERGFDGATVRGIAARIDLTHGMIRYHYDNKEQLWFAAVEHLFERQFEFLKFSDAEELEFPRGTRARFAKFLRRYVYYCAKYPEHARILMQETVSPTPRMRKALKQQLREPHQTAVEEIRLLQENGVLKMDAPPASIMYMISGACQNLFALAPEVKVTLDYNALSHQSIEDHADLIVATFVPE
ncbi:MAG: TetR/AcrR family transcriptional regulator [Pseudomonadota bacterium]